MLNLYADSFLLSCPQRIPDIDNFIENISLLDSLKESSLWSLYISTNVYETLSATQTYPSYPAIQGLFKKAGIVHIQAQDAYRLTEALFAKLPTIEKALEINQLRVNINSSPSGHLSSRDIKFKEDYHQLIGAMIIFYKCRNEANENQILITRDLDDNTSLINVDGEVASCNFTVCSPANIAFPLRVSTAFPVCDNERKLYKLLEPVKLWESAQNENDYKKAIEIYNFRKYDVLDKGLHEKYSFGRKFLETCRDLGFLNDERKIERLLRSCSETLLEENMPATHHIRADAGPNSPQQMRGNDGAWRRDIDHDYHLHYWKTPFGYELASVVMHYSCEIPR